MKRILKTTLIAAAVALSLSSPLMAAEVPSVGEARQEAARHLATLVNDTAFNHALQGQLHKNQAMLADVLLDYEPKDVARGEAAKEELRDLDRQAIRYRGLDGAVQGLLDLHVSGTGGRPLANTRGVWAATIVKNPVTRQKELVAYDDRGIERRYPADAAPDVPMLVVESTNAAALSAGMRIMNESLRQGGLQSEPQRTTSRARSFAGSQEDVSVLTDIFLADDREPNTAGDAEVFAIISGVNPEGKAEIINVDMPWLDHDKRWYRPGQDFITWRNFGANYVNVQIFEDDGDFNYKELTKAVVSAVGDVSLLVSPGAPYALISAGLAKIANTIIDVMPGRWFENSVDYIDSFYMLERGSHYTRNSPRVGARGWAKIGLAPRVISGPGVKTYVDKSTEAQKPGKNAL